MFSLSSSNRYYLYKEPTDMRKSFDGLCGLVRNHLQSDPCSGHVYVFINRRRDKIKLLHWEPGGFVLYYKSLESGTFEVPDIQGGHACISWSQLMLITEGIVLGKVHRRKRFFPHGKSA